MTDAPLNATAIEEASRVIVASKGDAAVRQMVDATFAVDQDAERRALWRARMRRWPIQLLLIVLLLGSWQLASGRIIEDFFISSPSAITLRFWIWLRDGTLLVHAMSTLVSTISGFLIGGFIAIVVGYFLGMSRFWAAVIEPFITALWGMPRIALIPLLVIWVGIGQPLAITMAAILSFFLLFFNTYYGVREVSQGLIDSMRVMGGNAWDVAWMVRVPSAFVWIAAGIKLSLPMALVGVVTAEMLASNVGLGYLVQYYGNSFDTAGAFAALLALLILGVVLDRLLTIMSKRALLWKNVSSLEK